MITVERCAAVRVNNYRGDLLARISTHGDKAAIEHVTISRLSVDDLNEITEALIKTAILINETKETQA